MQNICSTAVASHCRSLLLLFAAVIIHARWAVAANSWGRSSTVIWAAELNRDVALPRLELEAGRGYHIWAWLPRMSTLEPEGSAAWTLGLGRRMGAAGKAFQAARSE